MPEATCDLCGGPRSPISKSLCLSCYRSRGLRRSDERKKVRARDWQAEYRRRNPSLVKYREHVYRTRIKREVVDHYGGRCACCGETEIEFLTMDHVDGGGNEHRRQIGTWAKAIYRWLIRNGFPNGFRVLCQNCNAALGHHGYCPHAGRPERVRPATIQHAPARPEHGRAQAMTESSVLAMREAHARGDGNFSVIGAAFGVSKVTARNVIQRRTWQHI